MTEKNITESSQHPQIQQAVQSLTQLAHAMFPDATVNSYLYHDPEEHWEKTIFELNLPEAQKEDAFNLEEKFIDAVCDDKKYHMVLNYMILRVH
jgi:hypothetical protein